MNIYFTVQASAGVIDKLGTIYPYENSLEDFFKGKSYSKDLEYLYIGLFCMSPNFEPFFAPHKPKYTAGQKVIIHHGVQLEKKAKSLEYEIRLDFETYDKLDDIRAQLANDVINSLDDILLCKKIKQLDIERFKQDFAYFFKNIGWL